MSARKVWALWVVFSIVCAVLGTIFTTVLDCDDIALMDVMLCTRYNVTHQIMYGTNKDGSDDHVWVEANLNGKWVPLNYTGNYKYVRTESLLMLIKQVKNDYRRSR